LNQPAPQSRNLRLVEYDVERRVQLTFAVSAVEAQKFLVPPWGVTEMAPGPSEGANLVIAFRNRLLTVHNSVDGTTQPGEQDRGAVWLY
jgi:hypothetical protein